MSSTSREQIVFCKGCDKPCRVIPTIIDELGGQYYCGDCRHAGNVPRKHPQYLAPEDRK